MNLLEIPMLRFAKEIGKFPLANRLEGIETDIKYARAINGVKRTYKGSRKRTFKK
ncbi:MAG: hypothetical protein RMJ81_07520 [Candidatus Kryptonium sp.]|nr:hypothetical protein [Candidatus Kryptonium sp.]MDW8109484.1 hypothetical protein [Candidatus Kryptonium sp.]